MKAPLKGEFAESARTQLFGTTGVPFEAGGQQQIAVKVIDDRGNELLEVKPFEERAKAC